jgi:hypothetical protein
MASLAKIFKNDNFLKPLKKYKNRTVKSKPIFIPLFKELHIKLPEDKVKPIKRSNKTPKPSAKVYRPTGSLGAPPSTQEDLLDGSLLLATINANLYEAVVAQMTGGQTLQNRTGTFARSVMAHQVLMEKGNPVVTYSYEQDPYDVFSSSKVGRAPWNSKRLRDPKHIIDSALRSLGYNKLLDSINTIQ